LVRIASVVDSDKQTTGILEVDEKPQTGGAASLHHGRGEADTDFTNATTTIALPLASPAAHEPQNNGQEAGLGAYEEGLSLAQTTLADHDESEEDADLYESMFLVPDAFTGEWGMSDSDDAMLCQ
jgi:hypothetical protein